jgi:ketosteroid isomerase-like protein
MPHDYTHTVRSFYEAFAHRDNARFVALLDPEIEWTSAESFLYADESPYVGVGAVCKLIFGRVFDDWDAFSMSPGEILGGGEIVIASGRFRGKFKENGAAIDAQFVQVFQFKDGRISKCQMYTDTARFKEAISQIRSGSL